MLSTCSVTPPTASSERFDALFPMNSLSLYLHWPFCLSKCPYCAFNSYPVLDLIDFEGWRKAYFFALQRAAHITSGRTLRSIYFGGGTPSLMPPSLVEAILTEVIRLWPLAPDVEITLEMNPGDATRGRIEDFRATGINRLSIGVQSMTNEGLAVLGRRHSVHDSLITADLCAKFFDNFSLDLMYAWPGHSLEMWEQELTEALAIGAPHLSLYQLTVESESVFGTMYRQGELLLPDDEICAGMFERSQELTVAHGIPAYEISNHARPGYESVHNIGYWLYRDYMGIGPGAHGRLTVPAAEDREERKGKLALVQESNPQKWLRTILDQQEVLEEVVELSSEEQSKEALLVGLRMNQGILCSTLPLPLERAVKPEALGRLIEEAYLTLEDGVLKATARGRECLNALTAYLIP